MHLSDWWYERIVVRFDSEPILTHTPYCLRPLGPAPNYCPNNQYNQSVGYINMDNPILLLCLTDALYNTFHGILRAMYDGYWFICPQKKNDFKKSKSRLSVGSRPTSITNSFEIRQTLAFLPGLRRFGNLVWISNSTFLDNSTRCSGKFQLFLDNALFCTININILQPCGPMLNWNSWQGAANQMSGTWPTCFSIIFWSWFIYTIIIAALLQCRRLNALWTNILP